jgi:multiple sugar transport system permease protein
MKGWLYLIPAIAFLGVFVVYPLFDVIVYSFEEGYNSASQTFFGTGIYNFQYVLRDPYFIQALKNTFILVIVTVPLSTLLALLISVGLSSIKKLQELYQTIFFLPYVTNTLAVGLVFMILFQKTPYTDGFVNQIIHFFGGSTVDFIDGPYWAKMTVMCIYTVWVVMPFKILILTSALASVNPDYYKAAKVDGTSSWRIFYKITLPMISPTIFYLVITRMMAVFKIFGSIDIFTAGTSIKSNISVVVRIYGQAFGDYNFGYASAMSMILFGIILVVTIINFWGQKKWVHY